MMYYPYKHKPGDVVNVFCCNSCVYKSGLAPKSPADSGTASWLCDVCGHYNIGSKHSCVVGEWLQLTPLEQ